MLGGLELDHSVGVYMTVWSQQVYGRWSFLHHSIQVRVSGVDI